MEEVVVEAVEVVLKLLMADWLVTRDQHWIRPYKTVSYPQAAQGDNEQYKVVTVLHFGQLAELDVVAASPGGLLLLL